jgi:predicted O-linked N-acetylglucosamine transferase (SPINDLY family)
LDETIDVLQQALSKHPKSLKPLNNLLYVMTYHDRYSSKEYVEIARDFGRMLSSRVPFLLEFPKTLLDPDVGPLRVGIVSGDLRNHPVGFFLENVLSHLNPERIELVAYPTNSMENELTARIKHRFSKWHPIVDLSDECAAKLVRDDGIHLLVDLSGHTGHNRLPLFSLKPAPVQATWLGYWASTGVAEIDYILVDPISVPESDQAQFTETVWYLPDTRLCPSPLDGRLPIAPLPAQAIGGITFGCFQQLTKINDNVLATWGRIFGALPYARLRIQDKRLISPVIREQLLQRLKRIGIVAERVSLHGHSSRDEYLASHADVDIILDTFPYPGGTTTCEALWMGVPTITLAGNSLLSRQGASLLGCCGLEEWVAHDMDEYVNLAIYHASDIERLATMRLGLRKRALASPLFDAQRFARNLELAFFGMWRSKMASLSSPHAQC